MKLLVDREIYGATTAFAALGAVRTFDGRALNADDIKDADVLLVRSVTRVDRVLLADSSVRFVGTATAGTDHVDLDYLKARDIAFAAAPGCNARAVAEHVVCCLYAYSAERGGDPRALKVGIVGYGHVGSALGALLQRLAIDFVVNDPPRGPRIAGVTCTSLEALLGCDVVSLHVPLIADGPHPTRGLLGAAELGALRPGALLINAARGGIIDERALLARLIAPRALYAALDCWSGEPHIWPALLARSWRASTHIAGHTLEARIAAARMLHTALSAYGGVAAGWPENEGEITRLSVPGDRRSVAAVLASVYPLATRSEQMRTLAGLAPPARGPGFDEQRRRDGLHRQFAAFSVARAGLDNDTVQQLSAMDFDVH